VGLDSPRPSAAVGSSRFVLVEAIRTVSGTERLDIKQSRQNSSCGGACPVNKLLRLLTQEFERPFVHHLVVNQAARRTAGNHPAMLRQLGASKPTLCAETVASTTAVTIERPDRQASSTSQRIRFRKTLKVVREALSIGKNPSADQQHMMVRQRVFRVTNLYDSVV